MRERRAYERNRRLDVAQDQLRFHTHHAVPKPPQPLVPARIRRAALPMASAVHLNHQSLGRCEEVRNVAVAEHDLPLESDTQDAVTQRLPQRVLRRSRRMQHAPRPGDEKC